VRKYTESVDEASSNPYGAEWATQWLNYLTTALNYLQQNRQHLFALPDTAKTFQQKVQGWVTEVQPVIDLVNDRMALLSKQTPMRVGSQGATSADKGAPQPVQLQNILPQRDPVGQLGQTHAPQRTTPQIAASVNTAALCGLADLLEGELEPSLELTTEIYEALIVNCADLLIAAAPMLRHLLQATSDHLKEAEEAPEEAFVEMQEDLLALLFLVEKAKLGSGARFKDLSRKIGKKGGVEDPDAVAAGVGSKKFGKEKFQKLGAKGKGKGKKESMVEMGSGESVYYEFNSAVFDNDLQIVFGQILEAYEEGSTAELDAGHNIVRILDAIIKATGKPFLIKKEAGSVHSAKQRSFTPVSQAPSAESLDEQLPGTAGSQVGFSTGQKPPYRATPTGGYTSRYSDVAAQAGDKKQCHVCRFQNPANASVCQNCQAPLGQAESTIRESVESAIGRLVE